MKFGNKLKFFSVLLSCVVSHFVFSSFSESGCSQSPVQNSRKRACSINESPARNIKQALMQEITSPVVVVVQANLARVKESPGDSKTKIYRETIDFVFDRITDSQATAIVQNKQIIDALRSPDKLTQRTIKILSSATKFVSQGDRDKIAVVDLEHVATPTIKNDKFRNIPFVSGGHCLESYEQGMLSPQCFVGQDNCTLGVLVGGNQAKTILSRFDEDAIFRSWQSRKKIAEDGQLEMYHTGKNLCIAAFCKNKDSIKYDTMYPILVTKTSLQNKFAIITLGFFAELSSDYKKIENAQRAELSVTDCKAMVKIAKKLSTEPGSPELFDVTKQVEIIFQSTLLARGFHKGKLPGRLFILDDAKILIEK